MFLGKAGRAASAIAASMAIVALTSCGDDPVSTSGPAACTGNVTVTVTGGTTPTFSWTPACSVVALIVEESANDQWNVIANGDPGFGPSVVYGTKPGGSTQVGAVTPLRAGVSYSVTLFRGPLATPVVSALQLFTP
jgi:hypothetical protein